MIGVIADDLTGAAELGAVGRRHGLRAEVVWQGPPSGRADLVCVDTDSRSCSPAEAGRRAAEAAKLLQAAGARWIYKKVDSVLRGQVTAEVEAVMRQLQYGRALLLPANPSLGRTIREGLYYVKGKLIHKTEFARDPEYPRRWSQVLRMLKVPENFAIRSVNGDRLLPDQTIVVGDADSPAHVSEWAARISAGTLPSGGSEFFNALLELEKPVAAVVPAVAPPPPAGCELFVCGTTSQSSKKFVAEARRRKEPVISLPQELTWGAEFGEAAVAALTHRAVAAFTGHSRVILAVGLPLVRQPEVAKALSRHVAQLAEGVLAQVPVARIFAEGGATAAELVRRMGWSRLTVERELAPGVATLAVGDGNAVWLTIKPGTYAWPEKWT